MVSLPHIDQRTASDSRVLVTEKQVTDFFSFCGKIQSLKMEADGAEKQKATITFERPSAARTALLLQDAHLGTSQVHVSTSIPLDGTSTPPSSEPKHDTDFSQEDKPRTAVAAGIPPQSLFRY
jgi:RNA recognition motif-containing protein